MRLENVNSIDNNGSYELIVICKNESEENKAFDKLADFFILENFEELEINVYASKDQYRTKSDFVKEVRKILKEEKMKETTTIQITKETKAIFDDWKKSHGCKSAEDALRNILAEHEWLISLSQDRLKEIKKLDAIIDKLLTSDQK